MKDLINYYVLEGDLRTTCKTEWGKEFRGALKLEKESWRGTQGLGATGEDKKYRQRRTIPVEGEERDWKRK